MHIAVTAVGLDRPGIVAAITKTLYEHGANIEDSRSAILGGHFSMMLIVAMPDGSDAASLEGDLVGAAGALDLIVAVRPVAEAPHGHTTGIPHVISVYGADRPGIVARVSDTLASHNVNITDLATHVVEGDTPVYVMLLEATIPVGADPEPDLKALGAELGVDVSIRPMEADTL